MKRRFLPLLLAVAAVGMAACGIPTDGEPTEVAQDALPEALRTDQATSTTVTEEVIQAPRTVRVVFRSQEGGLVRIDRSLPQNPTPVNVVTKLIEGPTEAELDEGVKTDLDPQVPVVSVSEPDGAGTVEVEMDGEFWDMGQELLRGALEQIVVTLIEAWPEITGVLFVQEGGEVREITLEPGGGPVTVPLTPGHFTGS